VKTDELTGSYCATNRFYVGVVSMLTAVWSTSMSKQAAMALYSDRPQRTAVLHVDSTVDRLQTRE